MATNYSRIKRQLSDIQMFPAFFRVFVTFYLLFGISILNAQVGGINSKANKQVAVIKTVDENEIRKNKKHEDLETELEIYPLNLIALGDPVVKNEAMFDYHLYSKNEKLLGGVRFFGDANTHYGGTRDMKDLIMYTTGYFGHKIFQMGAEVGSITGQEYISIGPQITSYDNLVFKRVSIISRVLPDYVFGYEFTTQETKLFHTIKLSGTGMGRWAIHSNQIVIQASIWFSIERFRGLFLGVEYEYDNARYFNNNAYEKNNELFFGVKFELY